MIQIRIYCQAIDDVLDDEPLNFNSLVCSSSEGMSTPF